MLNHHGTRQATPEPYDDGRSLADNGIDGEGDGFSANDAENPQSPPTDGGIVEYLNVCPRFARFTVSLIAYRSWRPLRHRCCKMILLKHRASTS